MMIKKTDKNSNKIKNTCLPWFALKRIPGLGNVMFRRLIQEFGTPQNVFDDDGKRLKQIQGMKPAVLEGIRNKSTFNSAEHELKALSSAGVNVVTLNDPDYPPLLKQIPDPPPYLTYIGSLEISAPCVSIVGSRQATNYGMKTARKLSFDLTRTGFQIVSGMALGIDTAAHQGALEAKGRTIAVLGSGLARIYPKTNRHLFNTIADQGAVISEFDLMAEPEPHNFPIRNRIIAGLSTGTIVVEAAVRSGSLITARLAGDYCREVFAVPGSIHSFKSSGTHALLKQGAALVENHHDVIDQLHHMVHIETCRKGVVETPRKQKPPPEMTTPYHNVLIKIL